MLDTHNKKRWQHDLQRLSFQDGPYVMYFIVISGGREESMYINWT